MGNERRNFLKVAAAGAAAATLPWTTAATGRDRVRLGFIGTGLRGQDHLDLAVRRADDEDPARGAMVAVQDQGLPRFLDHLRLPLQLGGDAVEGSVPLRDAHLACRRVVA